MPEVILSARLTLKLHSFPSAAVCHVCHFLPLLSQGPFSIALANLLMAGLTFEFSVSAQVLKAIMREEAE